MWKLKSEEENWRSVTPGQGVGSAGAEEQGPSRSKDTFKRCPEGRGPSGLHRPRGGRVPAPPPASKGPGGDLASVPFQLRHPLRQETVSAAVRGRQSKLKVRQAGERPRKHNRPQPLVAALGHFSYLQHRLLTV